MTFGEDTANLKNASVYVQETLVLGGGARDIRSWDVRRLLAIEAEAWAASPPWSADALGGRGFGEKGSGNQGFGKHGLGVKGLSDKGLGERKLGEAKAQNLAGARGGRSDDMAQEGDGGEKGAVRSNGRSASDVESEGGCPLRSEKVVQTGMLPGIEKGGRDAAPFQRASELNADGSRSKTADQEGLVDSVKGGPRAFESASGSAFSFLWDDDELRTCSDIPVLIILRLSRHPY
jgi:hypothetical protein